MRLNDQPAGVRNCSSRVGNFIFIVLVVLAIAPQAQAAFYSPGETLDPACAPTDPGCGIVLTVATSTANSIPYYAESGGILSATSTLSILQNGMVSLRPITASYTVGSGGDYPTLTSAFSTINQVALPIGGVVTLNVLDGGTTEPGAIYAGSIFGKQVVVQAQHSYSTSVSSIQSSAGSSGAWSIVLNVTSVANLSTASDVAITGVSGGINPTFLAGVFPITNVDAINSRITISSTHRAASPPSGAVTGTVNVLPRIRFSGTDGIDVWNGNAVLNISGVSLVGDGTAGKNGLSVQDLGRVYVQDILGVRRFGSNNILLLYNSQLNAQGPIVSSASGGDGIGVQYASSFTAPSTVSTGNANNGVTANGSGTVNLTDGGSGSIVSGNGNSGAVATNGANISAGTATASANTVAGFATSGRGMLGASTAIASGNGTDFDHGVTIPLYMYVTNSSNNLAAKITSDGGGNGYFASLSSAGNVLTYLGQGSGISYLQLNNSSGANPAYLSYGGNSNAFRFGLDGATAAPQTLWMSNVSAGTVDGSGGLLSIELSQGTGTGLGGGLQINCAPHGVSGSTQNPLTACMTINGDTKAAAFFGALTTSGSFSAASVTSSGAVVAGANSALVFSGKSFIQSFSDGTLELANNAGNNFGRLQFGGATSSFPALKRSGATIAVRLADDSADAGLTAGTGTFSGNVGIGTTSPATKLEVGGTTANVTLDGYLSCSGFTSNANGLLTCTASDQRLKTDIEPLDASRTVDALNALEPISFYWKPGADRGGQQQYGFIAQDVASVFPELVTISSPTALTPDGTLTVNYDGLIAPLVVAVQHTSRELGALAQSMTTAVLNATLINTEKLCIGSTCISETQLQRLIEGSNPENSPAQQNGDTGAASNEETDTEPTNSNSSTPDQEISHAGLANPAADEPTAAAGTDPSLPSAEESISQPSGPEGSPASL